jgi:glycosyltransferase involved in cell wall biosynthesis/2-polyprenyl-3-methyl-5-hydroxy-6-metoxy-1,4-benzoquinol methylase
LTHSSSDLNKEHKKGCTMKILIFAHNGNSGGAEYALRRLIDLLRARHEVHIVLPNIEGDEHIHYRSLGLPCYHLPVQLSLPHFSNTALQYARSDLRQIANTLQKMDFDIAISNTIATLHGGLIAKHIGIPHLTYAHEFPEDELTPSSISGMHYLRLIEELSTSIISCSHFASEQFSREKRSVLNVLVPYDYNTEATPQRTYGPDSEYVIQVIGARSIRKNMHFAATLAKSLDLLGTPVRLDIIGQDHDGSAKLARTLDKRKIRYRVLGHVPRPYDVNLQERVVTLVCSKTEAYGLTIPESLRVGVPVIASKSGGPAEILPEPYLYEKSDLDECVQKIRKIFDDYGNQVQTARQIYGQLQHRHCNGSLTEDVDAALLQAKEVFDPQSESAAVELIDAIKQGLDLPLDAEILARNISATQSACGVASTPSQVSQAVDQDARHPGLAVLEDIKTHKATPFAMSKNMDELYKHGVGLSIELASTHNDHGRLQMSAFIISALHEKQHAMSRPMKILALGDGIGIDTIRLAMAGFSIDYIDYDQSNMSKIAEFNFHAVEGSLPAGVRINVIKSIRDTYDALICLEVIEHVPDPIDFSKALNGHLNDDGLLCISECFNGIENRWPTHLYTNEQYAGLMPFMLLNNFKLSKTNMMPYAKPYIFTKRTGCEGPDALELLLNRSVMTHLVSNQMDVGF